MHPTRLEILRELRKAKEKSFSQLLKDVAETSDNLTYHLKHMIRDGVVESPSKGTYRLAERGRLLINTNQDKYEGLFPTLSVMLMIRDENGSRLLMRKTKQPHIGKLHDVTFMLRSEVSLEECIQEFCNRYKMVLRDIEFCKTFRKRVLAQDGQPMFDKTFLIHTAKLTSYTVEIEDRKFELRLATLIGISEDVLRSTKDTEELLKSKDRFVEKYYESSE